MRKPHISSCRLGQNSLVTLWRYKDFKCLYKQLHSLCPHPLWQISVQTNMIAAHVPVSSSCPFFTVFVPEFSLPGKTWASFSANISELYCLMRKTPAPPAVLFAFLTFLCFRWFSCVPSQPQTFRCGSFSLSKMSCCRLFLELQTCDVSRWTDTQSLFHRPHMKRKRH